MKRTLMLAVTILATAVFGFGQGYTTFGDAGITTPGNASPRGIRVHSADYNVTSEFFGGIDFDVPAGLTVDDLDRLSTDFKWTAGGCGGGSPRFVVVTTAGVLNFYLGDAPDYLTCGATGVYQNSGNLAAPDNLVDAQGLGFYTAYSDVQASYGSAEVTGIFLVMDGGWKVGGDQTFEFDNTTINETVYTYELPVATDANQCKDGGWQGFTREDGTPFKNQGDCVSYTRNGK